MPVLGEGGVDFAAAVRRLLNLKCSICALNSLPSYLVFYL